MRFLPHQSDMFDANYKRLKCIVEYNLTHRYKAQYMVEQSDMLGRITLVRAVHFAIPSVKVICFSSMFDIRVIYIELTAYASMYNVLRM